ncbi:MAG TPA: ribosome recycling factor [Luteimonas sp.]|nr:ribosome recycling factor [Luteimonas sp.]
MRDGIQGSTEEAAHRARAHQPDRAHQGGLLRLGNALESSGNIATEDARTLTVSPWEKSMVPVIEKAIYKSDLGLTPNTAGTLIRINMPALTEERRRDIIKVVKSEAENARVAVRGVRREVMNELKEMLKEKLIAQDDDRRAQDDVQKLTDKHVAEIDHAMADKEKELLQV